jgi:hypothetical protein
MLFRMQVPEHMVRLLVYLESQHLDRLGKR